MTAGSGLRGMATAASGNGGFDIGGLQCRRVQVVAEFCWLANPAALD
jgi:hypothetical protein